LQGLIEAEGIETAIQKYSNIDHNSALSKAIVKNYLSLKKIKN